MTTERMRTRTMSSAIKEHDSDASSSSERAAMAPPTYTPTRVRTTSNAIGAGSPDAVRERTRSTALPRALPPTTPLPVPVTEEAQPTNINPTTVMKEEVREHVAPAVAEAPVSSGPAKHAPEVQGESVTGAVGGFVVRWIADILKLTIMALRTPISYVLVAYASILIVSYSSLFLANTVQRLLSPICRVPVVNMLPIPWCQGGMGGQDEPDYKSLMDLQERFEKAMENSLGGSGIVAIDLKNSEIAIRDLNSLVKISDLNAKEQLSISIDKFVAGAKQAGRDLHHLNSGVGGAVDAIVAMDQYALRSLEMAEREAQVPRSTVAIILYPFYSPRSKVVETYNQAAAIMETNLRRLIMEAEGSIIILNELDNQLDIISDIAARESKDLKFKSDEVLGQLWSIVGGNRQQRGNFASHKALLSNIGTYRTRALAHVSTTLIHLQQLSSDLDDLRDRVGRPALYGSDTIIPIEVHMDTIRKGIERLEEGRKRAKLESQETLRRLQAGNEPPPSPRRLLGW